MTEKLHYCLICRNSHLLKDNYTAQTLNLDPIHGVAKCSRCGFRFLNPRPTALEYDEAYRSVRGSLVDIYPMKDKYYENEEMVRVEQYKKNLDLLHKIGYKVGEMLEIGSCTGTFLKEAQRRGYEITGVEPSQKNAEVAKNNYGIDLKVGNIEDFNFNHESFDIVYSSHVFEHLLDPSKVMRKVSSWIKSGGVIMIEVPNQFGNPRAIRWRALRKCKKIERSFLSIHHPLFFDRRTLKKLVHRFGFEVKIFKSIYYREPIRKTPKIFISRFIDSLIGGNFISIIAIKN